MLVAIAAHAAATALLVRFPGQEASATNQDRLLAFHPGAVSALTLGHGRMVSSLAWVATMVQSDTDHLQEGEGRSWMHRRFTLISRLDPWFYHLYSDGGLYLSVIKDDTAGAKELIDLGLARFPDDFWLNYFGAFNDLFELGLVDDALAKYRRILDHPLMERNARLKNMVAKITGATAGAGAGAAAGTGAGGGRDPSLAADVLSTILPRVRDPRARKKIRDSLRSLRERAGEMERVPADQ